jgi:asparagine synthase (glutamine-hydrolysing)
MTAMTSDLLERIARHSAVALTGDGGDPLFVPSTLVQLLGSRRLGAIVIDVCRSAWRTRTMPPLGIRSVVRQWLSRESDRAVPPWLSEAFVRRCDLEERRAVLGRRHVPAGGPRGTAASAITDLWWTSMFETYDPGATRRAVDLRCPLFDIRFIAFALSLPTHPWCINKELVRSAMRGRLPDAICARPKSPLAVDPVRVHGRLTVDDMTSAIAAVPELAAYIDVQKFTGAVREDGVMADSPGTWSAMALATWLRCAAGVSVAA